VHQIWLKLSGADHLGSRLHHRDVVGVALRRLYRDLEGEDRTAVLEEMEKDLRKN
jgi:hypothetical protein